MSYLMGFCLPYVCLPYVCDSVVFEQRALQLDIVFVLQCTALQHNCSKGFCVAMTNIHQLAAAAYNIDICMSLAYQGIA